MNRSALDDERLLAEASEWLARLNGEKVGPTTRSHFIQWLMRSYVNVDAFLDASLILGEISNVKAMPPAAELARAVRDEPRNSNVIHLRPTYDMAQDVTPVELPPLTARRSLLKVAAAATVAAATGSVSWLAYRAWDREMSLSTRIGEQRSVTLEDGTSIQLNTDTALTVRMEKAVRRIVLLRGEARFEVAKDPNRPFLVSTPQAVVRALGTAFNVRIIEARTVVSVIEGRIRVVNRKDGDAEAAAIASGTASYPEGVETVDSFELTANGQLSVAASGSVQANGGPPFDRAVSWTKHHIVFVDEPLSVVVAEFNRYSKQPLEIADPALAEHRIDGGFDAFDRAALLEYLNRYQGVQVAEENGRLMMRRAHPVDPDG
jgi:transmembrane sensor